MLPFRRSNSLAVKPSHLGVLEIDRNQRIVGFEEKPKEPEADAVESESGPGLDGYLCFQYSGSDPGSA